MFAVIPVIVAMATAPPVIDGVFNEWEPDTLLAVDPPGDAVGPLDITALRAVTGGPRLFIQIDLANPLNLSSGPAGETTLRLDITSNAGRSITVDFRGRKAFTDNDTSAVLTWPAIDFACMPTIVSNRFELRVNLSPIGVAPGSTLSLQFSGADSLTTPAVVEVVGTEPVAARRSADRSSCSDIRIASLNTFVSGLIDPTRQASFSRLIDAVNADVYCFQEEYSSSAAQIRSLLNTVDPTDNGLPWNTLRSGNDLVIASQWPMIPLTISSRYFGVVVRPTADRAVLVLTNHPNCCGYGGSAEDAARIAQAQEAITRFTQFRNGTAGAALAPYKDAPALLVGDWNLVGSSTPLDLWTQAPIPGMKQLMLSALIGSDVSTWSSPSGLDFWPGVLDLLVYDPTRLFPRHQFTLDTTLLQASELASLGLLASDSLASDHKLLVADFAYAPSSDFNHDGFVTGDDFDAFTDAYVAGQLPADFDGNGFVTGDDFDAYSDEFESGC